MDERCESRAGFLDQPNRRFAEETQRALAADEKFRKIEAASRKPIGKTEKIVATTVLADRRTFLHNQRGMILEQRPQIMKRPVRAQQIAAIRIVEPIGLGIQPVT